MVTCSGFQGRLIVIVVLVAVATPTRVATVQAPDRVALLDLHQQLLESVILRSETTLLAAAALPNLIVVPPGGIVENRDQVLSGVRNVAAKSVEIDNVVIADHGTTAVVVARVIADRGAAATAPGRIRMMSVFVYDHQKWRLLARSITPCIERAVVAGRC